MIGLIARVGVFRGVGFWLARPLTDRCAVQPACPSCQGLLICGLPASDKDSSVLTKLNPSRFHLSFGCSRASTITSNHLPVSKSRTCCHRKACRLVTASSFACTVRNSRPAPAAYPHSGCSSTRSDDPALYGPLPPIDHSVTVHVASDKQIGEDEYANHCFNSRLCFECPLHEAHSKAYHLVHRGSLNTKPKQSNCLFHRSRGSLTSIC